jgi:hypothetical protein
MQKRFEILRSEHQSEVSNAAEREWILVSIFIALKPILNLGAHEAFGKGFHPMSDNRVFLVFLRE